MTTTAARPDPARPPEPAGLAGPVEAAAPAESVPLAGLVEPPEPADLPGRLRAVRAHLRMYAVPGPDRADSTDLPGAHGTPHSAGSSDITDVHEAFEADARPRGGTPPEPDWLAVLARRCGLSPFERDVLALAAGCALDPSLAELCARAHGDPARPFATFGLALAALPGPHWDAVAPDGPLRALALVELDTHAGGLVGARLGVDERVLLALVGLDVADPRLAELAETVAPAGDALPARHGLLLERAAACWAADETAPLVLWGRAGDRRCFERALAHRLGAPRLWRLEAAALPADPAEAAGLVARFAREARLTGSPVVLDLDDADPAQLAAARRWARRLGASARRVVLSSAEPVTGLPAGTFALELPDVTLAENVGLWNAALGPAAALLDGQVERFAGQFRLPADQLRAAATDLAVAAGLGLAADLDGDLGQAGDSGPVADESA
ncbi:hypothetical protein I6A94_42375, partial [Frankia sp. CN4]|nr:hypothetical protein [Frankia nepalensis]